MCKEGGDSNSKYGLKDEVKGEANAHGSKKGHVKYFKCFVGRDKSFWGEISNLRNIPTWMPFLNENR